MKPKNSRILIFVILRAQKQLTLTVGKIMDLSLESFTSVSLIAHIMILENNYIHRVNRSNSDEKTQSWNSTTYHFLNIYYLYLILVRIIILKVLLLIENINNQNYFLFTYKNKFSYSLQKSHITLYRGIICDSLKDDCDNDNY